MYINNSLTFSFFVLIIIFNKALNHKKCFKFVCANVLLKIHKSQPYFMVLVFYITKTRKYITHQVYTYYRYLLNLCLSTCLRIYYLLLHNNILYLYSIYIVRMLKQDIIYNCSIYLKLFYRDEIAYKVENRIIFIYSKSYI